MLPKDRSPESVPFRSLFFSLCPSSFSMSQMLIRKSLLTPCVQQSGQRLIGSSAER